MATPRAGLSGTMIVADYDAFYLLDVASGTRRDLLRGRFDFFGDPAWSPDGRWIVFTAGLDVDHAGLWIVRRDGRGLKNLEPAGGAGTCCPKWSRDGSRIAFSETANLIGDGLYIVPRTRARKPQLVRKFRGSCRVVGWAKRGFVVGVGSTIVFAPRTGATRQIASYDDFSQADLASDRYHVAYVSTLAIYSVGIDGKHRTRLLSDDGLDISRYDPVWSPDRRSLAFQTLDCSDPNAEVCENAGLWILILATGETRQVSPEPGEGDFTAFDWTAH